MDVLTHMLTEPLDPKEENDGQITEECMLGNCRVNLPEELLEDVSSFSLSPVIKRHSPSCFDKLFTCVIYSAD